MIVLSHGEVTRHSILSRTELTVDLRRAVGDRVQLQRVLMNLMTSGRDVMRHLDGTCVSLIGSQRGEESQLMVSVSPQQAEQIFHVFFTIKPHGTAMGLRITRSIVESHGGRLGFVDKAPRGAGFSPCPIHKSRGV